MNTDKLYLIEKSTYLQHIHEARLYGMLRDLLGQLIALQDERELVEQALHYRKACEDIRENWNIPRSYIVTQDDDALYMLFERELHEPEDAGYLFCNGLCDLCPDANDEEESDLPTDRKQESPNLKELMDVFLGALGEVLDEERQAESSENFE